MHFCCGKSKNFLCPKESLNILFANLVHKISPMAHLESRACISCGNTHIWHHASHGVHASGAVDHALSAVHGWQRGARCWHSQGSGEEGEEEERHVEAQVLLLDNSVFTAPRAVFIPLMPLVTYLPPSLCPRYLYLLSGGTCQGFTAWTQNRAFISFHHLCLTTLLT